MLLEIRMHAGTAHYFPVTVAEVVWNGNGPYFQALFYDMMEFDNEEITTSVTRDPSEFNLVFDESRHVSSALSSPFTEAIGAVVLLTSDNVLKWLIILNLFAFGHCHHGCPRKRELETCL